MLLKTKTIFHNSTILESEYYGHGSIYKKYAFYPSSWPILLAIPHGPILYDTFPDHLLAYNNLGVYTKRHQSYCLQKGKRTYHVPTAGLLHYEMTKTYLKKKQSRGSVFFNLHSTKWNGYEDNTNDILDFINDLEGDDFYPLTVCLHVNDFQESTINKYKSNGFEVICIGEPLNENYLRLFFDKLAEFKYVFTNAVGSHLLYSVILEKRIYYVRDLEPLVKFNDDPNELLLKEKGMSNIELLSDRFSKLIDGKVDQELRQLCLNELGALSRNSRMRIAFLLYRLYFGHLLSRVKYSTSIAIMKLKLK